MATLITNQAQLNFNYGGVPGTATSNVASTNLDGPLDAAKEAFSSTYQLNQQITYILTMVNNGTTILANVSIVDDLGTYQISGPIDVTPLTFIGTTARLFIDGVSQPDITVVSAAHSVTFPVGSLPIGSNAMVIYIAEVNSYAPLTSGSTITNTSTWTADDLAVAVEATETITVDAYANVSVVKNMSPDPVVDGDDLTYTFTMYNYGNTAADDVILTDTFAPIPDPITVTLNGSTVPDTDYDYSAVTGDLTLPNAAATTVISIPAATFTQNAVTGEYTINPGMTTVAVVGTI